MRNDDFVLKTGRLFCNYEVVLLRASVERGSILRVISWQISGQISGQIVGIAYGGIGAGFVWGVVHGRYKSWLCAGLDTSNLKAGFPNVMWNCF